MAVIQISNFGGEVPVQGVRNLPPNSAAVAVNTWLYSGELRGIHPNINLRTLASTTQKVFRIPRGTVGGDPSNPTLVPPPSYLGDSTWLEFTDPDTDIVRGPLINDKFKRWYFCSPSTGLRVNSYARLQAGEGSFKAGVPAPTDAPSVSQITFAAVGEFSASGQGGMNAYSTPTTVGVLGVTGTSKFNANGAGAGATTQIPGFFTTRAYAYTYVNIWGEESGPSPAITAAGADNGAWYITNILDPDADAFDDYVPFDHKVVYRSITGASGVTTYFRVGTVGFGNTTFVDAGTDSVVSGNLQFDNANGLTPPDDIEGIIAMPNGFFIGFSDSNVYFSEPYKPHSWPVEYIVSTEFPIVGLGVFGQTCAIVTEGYPSLVSGISPGTTSLSATNVVEPGLSRGSIVSSNDGVYYASPNGLVSISPNGVINTTQALITKEEWIKNFSPNYMRSVRYQQGYLGLRCVPDKTQRTAFFLDLSALNVAVNELSEFMDAVNVQSDVWSAEVFSLKDNTVFHHDPSESSFFLPYKWTSKEFQYVKPNNFSVYEVFWDPDRFDGTTTDGGSILPAGVPLHLRVFADRRLVYDADVPFNGKPNKLPSGFKATTWQFEITGRAPLFTFQCADSVKELANA